MRPPADAVARLQHDDGQAGINQMPRGRDAGSARTDHNSVKFTHKSNPRSYLKENIYSAGALPAIAV
jgi:hypothetical protein